MVDTKWPWRILDSSHTLINPLDTVWRRMMKQSRRDNDLAKRHKENSFELCRFINREFSIAQMNNL